MAVLVDFILVRHAIAEDRAVWSRTARSDSERPLTEQGKERLVQAGSGLFSLISDVPIIITSPLVRAEQTARMLHTMYSMASLIVSESLAPGEDGSQVINQVMEEGEQGPIMLVGHEPDLSDLIADLVPGIEEGALHLKKASACCIRVEKSSGQLHGELRWLLTPKLLRTIAANVS